MKNASPRVAVIGGGLAGLVAADRLLGAGLSVSIFETYPEAGRAPDATSAATPAFWLAAGFHLAVDDDRFPVMRREL